MAVRSRPIEAGDAQGIRELTRGATLDLGCGAHKRRPDWVGVDLRPEEGVDIIGDVYEVLNAIPDFSVEGIFASHFLEHVADVPGMLTEIARVVRPGGNVVLIVPHFSNPYFYSDLTHRTFFGLYSLGYLVESGPFRRQVPRYTEPLDLQLLAARLVFKSPPPFVVRYAFKRLIEMFVNSSRWAQEFYEENLTGFVPCYEIRFDLIRLVGKVKSD
jgi:SAM-dependent methyltransferase